jgi:hypothetical protein
MSGSPKFNLLEYIYDGGDSKLGDGVGGGRFSFSIPPDTIVENYFAAGGGSPPSSPQLRPNVDERVAILIPEEDDFYLNGLDAAKDNDSEAGSPSSVEPLRDIQNMLDYPKACLLITSHYAKVFYKRPGHAAADARHIWKQAHLPRSACIQDIEYLLLDWAFTYAHLEIKDRTVREVAWLTKSQCVCRSTWSAFLHWILCACSTGGH